MKVLVVVMCVIILILGIWVSATVYHSINSNKNKIEKKG